MGKKREGIGLAVVMVVVTLLSILTGAFLVLNQSNFVLLRRSAEKMRSEQAALSGLQYARMRLEANSAWGLPAGPNEAFAGGPIQRLDVPGQMTVWEDGYCVVGIIAPEQAHFQIYFQPDSSHTSVAQHGRFLDRDVAADPNPNSWGREWFPARESRSLMTTPPGGPSLAPTADLRGVTPQNCNLIVTGYSSGAETVLDVTLGNAQIVDAPLMSEGTMAVELAGASGIWNVLSLDPSVNAKIRSRADLLAPAATRLLFGDGSQPMAGSAVSSTNVLLNPIINVSSDANGAVTAVTASGSPTVIGDGVNDGPEASAAGALVHGTVLPNSNQAEVPDLTADQLKTPPAPPLSLNSGLYHFVDPTTVHFWADPAHDPVADPTGFTPYVNEIRDGMGNLLAKLDAGRFIVPNGSHLESSGALRITGDLAVGYDAASLSLPAGANARLKVNGSLRVQGETVGGGTIVAEANGADVGAIQLTGKSAMSASPDSGVALYAEGPVSIEGVKPPTIEVLAMDHELFREAITDLPSSWDEFSGWYPQGIREWINWDDSDPTDNPKYWAGGADDHSLGEPKLRDSVLDNFDSVHLPRLLEQYPVGANDPVVQGYLSTMLGDYNSAGGVSLGRYIRLREFLQDATADPSAATVLASYNHWHDLHDAVIKDEVNALITSQMDYYAQQAGPALLEAYLMAPSPMDVDANPNDVVFNGLVYSRTSFQVNPNGNRFASEGAVISRGPLVVKGAREVRSTYNPAYLTSLLSYAGGAIKLEQRYWSMR
ncbi:hypothetical protein DYH09_26335 [bacterium CPR1]|nr:hypothetical protein [bacterium CPR1]